MVTTEELLKKNNVKSKLFQKIPYKPWESSFLIDEGKSAHEVDSNLITSPVVEGDGFKDLPPICVSEDVKTKGHIADDAFEKVILSNKEISPLLEIKSTDIEKLNTDDSIYSTSSKNSVKEISIKNEEIDYKVTSSNTLSKKNMLPLHEPVFRAQSLFGIPRTIIFHLLKTEKNRDEKFIYCEAISTNDLIIICKSTYKVVSVALNRLKKRGYLFSIDGKRGRGGYSIYSIPLFVVSEIEKWIERQSG